MQEILEKLDARRAEARIGGGKQRVQVAVGHQGVHLATVAVRRSRDRHESDPPAPGRRRRS